MNHFQENGMQQARALAWEFWAHGWRGQLLGLAGVVGFASLVYGAFSRISDLSFQGSEVGSMLHFGIFWVAMFCFCAQILLAWGPPQRRYTLPTSSFVIVASSIVCSMVSMFVLYAVAATTLNLLHGAGWPLWRPVLVAVISVAWLQAVLWSTSNSRGLQLVSSLASFGVLLYGVVKFASPGHPKTYWFYEDIDASLALAFGLASLVCVGVGTIGFANLRQGVGIDVDRIVDWIDELFPKAARETPFSSPTSAQFWLEWSDRGYIMPVGTALIGVSVLAITPFVSHPDAKDFVGGISSLLLMPAILVGIYLGSRSENLQFGNFNGTRPLSDSQVASAILCSVTVGIFSSALVWSAVLGAVWFILDLRTGQQPLQSMINQFGSIHPSEFATIGIRLFGITALGIGAIWGAVSLITSIFLAGRKVGVVVVSTVVGGWIVGGIGSELLLSDKALETFRYVFARFCIILPPVGIATAFFAGWWLHLISRGTLVLATAIVATMFLGAHFVFGFTSAPEPYLPALWGCSLAPAALAAAPLAVWWNRHR